MIHSTEISPGTLPALTCFYHPGQLTCRPSLAYLALPPPCSYRFRFMSLDWKALGFAKGVLSFYQFACFVHALMIFITAFVSHARI
jgi:hypothetical protein